MHEIAPLFDYVTYHFQAENKTVNAIVGSLFEPLPC